MHQGTAAPPHTTDGSALREQASLRHQYCDTRLCRIPRERAGQTSQGCYGPPQVAEQGTRRTHCRMPCAGPEEDPHAGVGRQRGKGRCRLLTMSKQGGRTISVMGSTRGPRRCRLTFSARPATFTTLRRRNTPCAAKQRPGKAFRLKTLMHSSPLEASKGCMHIVFP